MDAQTGEALPGVNVFLAYSARGTSSDAAGQYRLDRVPPGSYELVASMIGYDSQVRRVEVAQEGPPLVVDFRLSPTVYELDEVAVSAARDHAWQENYEQFTKLFLGTTDNAGATEILNPEVLDFEADPEWLIARAHEPLKIENRALGYRITFVLSDFQQDKHENLLYIAGFPYFEELVPANDDEAHRWEANREATFKGSLQHVLWALVHGRADEEGFVLRHANYDADPAALIRPTSRSYEYELLLEEPLHVYYAPDARRTILGNIRMSEEARRQVTHMFTAGPVTIHETGYPYAGSDTRGTLELSGHLGWHRVADMMPREYPAQVFSQSSEAVAAGTTTFTESVAACTASVQNTSALQNLSPSDFDTAIKRETERIEANPDDLEARYRRGVLYADRSKLQPNAWIHGERAIKDFEYIIARDLSFKDVFYQYALVYRYRVDDRPRHDFPTALELAHKQVDLKPESAIAHVGLAQIYRHFLFYSKPSHVRAWLEEHPSDYATYFTAELMRREGQLKEADALLRDLLLSQRTMLPQPILLSRARIHYALGYPEIAQDFVDQAQETIQGQREALFLFELIKYIVSPAELDDFQRLCSPEEYRRFFETFWAKRDPMPSSTVNMRMAEHFRRLDKAEEDYLQYEFRDLYDRRLLSWVFTWPATHALGAELDDRGIVYVRHGEPDDRVISIGERLKSNGQLGGEFLDEDGHVEGGPPPINESWLYTNPDLVFHFSSSGGASMRLVPYVADVSGTWYEDRIHWGRKRMGPPQVSPGDLAHLDNKRDVQQMAQVNVDTGLTTDRHAWSEETEHLEMPYMLAAFRGDKGQTLIDIYYTLPLKQLSDALADSVAPRVEIGVALHDMDWQEAGYRTEIWPVPRSEDPSAGAINVLRLAAPPDSFHVSFHGRSLQGKPLVGAYTFDYRVPDFSSPSLTMSDVVLAHSVEPATTAAPFVKNGLLIEANPGGGFRQADPVYVYFEIYNLTYGSEDRTRYEIRYTLTPGQRRGLARVFTRGDEEILSVASDYEGTDTAPVEYIMLDVGNVPPGSYDLHVTVRDTHTGVEVQRTRSLEIR